MITWDNYEEYMLMHADGELSAAEEAELQAFVSLHPGLEKELAALEMTVLKPDTTLVFGNKESLKKAEAAQKIIAIPVWRRYRVAAGIAALLFIALLAYLLPHNNGSDMPVGSSSQPAIAAPGTDTSHTEKVAQVPAPATPPAATNADTATKPVNRTSNLQPVVKVNTAQPDYSPAHPAAEGEQRENKQRENINSLAITQAKMLPSDSGEASKGEIKRVPVYTAVADSAAAPKKSLWDMLPLEDIKKRGMEKFAGAIAATYNEINTMKQDLSDKTISVKVHKRKLIISF